MSRYIDADAIQYRKVCKEEIDGNMRVEYMVLRDEIDDMQTADVIELGKAYSCSHYDFSMIRDQDDGEYRFIVRRRSEASQRGDTHD